MMISRKIANNTNTHINMTFKHIAKKIFHKNFLILSIILSVCTNALYGGELDRKLSLDDLHMVQSQLPENIFIHWIKIGILLHVQPPSLNEIAEQCTGDYRDTCTKMLHKWLTGRTMSNDMRKPTLRELAIVIGASCGGACPFAATQIFEQHGDGETYKNALEKLREHADTEEGQQNNHWAFVEHLLNTYFSSTENFSDSDASSKKLNLGNAPDAALPFLFALLSPFVTNQIKLHKIGLHLSVPVSTVNRIARLSSPISINALSFMLFELLCYALNNQPKKLKWPFIVEAASSIILNKQVLHTVHQAIRKNSKI